MPLKFPRFVGLRTRFMLVAVLLTLIFSSVWGFWSWQRESGFLRRQIEREGEMLVSTMAIPIINALLYEELGIIEEGGLLDNFVAEIMANRQLEPRYAFVVNLQGKVLAHNILSEFGQDYADPLTHEVLNGHGLNIRPAELNGEPLLDFGMPLAIHGKRWGGLRIGISLRPLHAELRLLATRIASFTLLFAIGALSAFTLVGGRLSKPLIKLAGDMEKVPDLPPDYHLEAIRGDEIGQLQQSFVRLVERLRRLEDERNRSVERLLDNERLATVGKLVSGVAHEVNNPLAGIEAALFNIRKRSTGDLQRYVDVVQREIDRIGGIVRQLLDLARAGSLEREKVASDTFLSEVDSFARMALKPLGVRYRFQNLCQAQDLCIDRDKLYQVVLNLVLNAADAARAAGSEAQVELLAYDSATEFCIQVKDNGPGVPEEIRDKIFELFFTTKQPGQGTGVGLAICLSIVDRHGGKLVLLDNEYQGATFLVKLPKKSVSSGECPKQGGRLES